MSWLPRSFFGGSIGVITAITLSSGELVIAAVAGSATQAPVVARLKVGSVEALLKSRPEDWQVTAGR